MTTPTDGSNWRAITEYHHPVLDKNAAFLSTHYPSIYNRLSIIYQQKALFFSETKNHILFAENKDDPCIFFDSHNRAAERKRVEQTVSGMTPQPHTQLFYILGLDIGFSLEKLLSYIAQSPLTALIIIEPDERIAACTFAVKDLSRYIQSNRVSFVIGDEYESQLERLYDEKNFFAAKEIKVFPSSTAKLPQYSQHWKQLQKITAKLRSTFQQKFQDEMKESQEYYTQHQHSPINSILSLHHTEGLAVRYIQQRFLEECRKQQIDVVNYHPGFANEAGIIRAINKHKPDCLLFMNRSPGEYVDIDLINTIKIPRMLWCVDDPNSFIKDPFHQHDIVFTWDNSYAQDMIKNGALHADHFPYVADLDHVQPKIRAEFISNVSYIGQVKAFDPSEFGFDDKTAELIRCVGKEKCGQPHRSYQSLLIEHQKQFALHIINDEKETVPRFIRYGIYTIANALRRINVLEAVIPFGLKLYGGEDWLKVLGDHPLTTCFQGVADPEKDVPDIFVSSKINLNIHSLQALTSLNQRDFNCPLAGGFILTDWVEGASQFFIPDEELVFYQSIDDLQSKIEYYLSHEDQRQEIIKKGRERVVKDHTYASRVPKVLQTLNQRIAEQL